MANANQPFGLRPYRNITGKNDGQANVYRIPASDTLVYNIGDVVRTAAGGDLVSGCSDVILFGTRGAVSTTGNTRGVIVGLGTRAGTAGMSTVTGFDPTNLEAMSIPATKTKDYFVLVDDSPDTVFEAQTTDTIAASAFNKNTGLAVGAAPSAGQVVSNTTVSGSTATTTITLPIKIIGAPNQLDNDLTAPGTYSRILVMLNTHELSGNTVGI